MRLINKSMNKKYNKYCDYQNWATDMLNGLKHDLKCNKNLCKGKPTINNYTEYTEAFYNKRFIEWFIENHFE